MALLLQAGFYFTAIKVVYANHELLHATLAEVQLTVSQGQARLGPTLQQVDGEDWQQAVQAWNWRVCTRLQCMSTLACLQYREQP